MGYYFEMPEYKRNGITYSLVLVQSQEKEWKYRLRIVGVGKIPGRDEYQPWSLWQQKISDIWIGEGITEIGDHAFAGNLLLEQIWLPESLIKVGARAFADCPELQEIYCDGGAEKLGLLREAEDAFPAFFYKHRKEG